MSEVSQKQIEANRENAKLGGVKTEEGKAVSRYNAVKHGLLSDRILMKGESKAALETLGQQIRNDIKPQSAIEFLLTDRITSKIGRASCRERV